MQTWSTNTKGVLLSIVLLISLFLLKFYQPTMLEIEAHWLAVAVLPIIVSLVLSGRIAEFSGFGIQLKATLEAEVSKTVTFQAKDTLSDVMGRDKDHLDKIMRLSLKERVEVGFIRLYADKKNYYDPYIIEQYLYHLPNVQFLEIFSSKNELIGLLPKSSLFSTADDEYNSSYDQDVIGKLVHAIDQTPDTVSKEFKDDLIVKFSKANEDLKTVLKTMVKYQLPFIAVLDDKKNYLGVCLREDIEHKIALSVLE